MRSIFDPASLSSGSSAVDDLLGGLIAGDNVVWVGTDRAIWQAVEAPFLTRSVAVRPTVVVACSAAERRRPVPAGVDVIDGSAGARRGTPTALADAVEAYLAAHPSCSVSVRGFDDLVRRWGEAHTVSFFARTCPTMLQAGALTYWWISPAHGDQGLTRIRQVTQVMLETHQGRLRVTKAESRPAVVVGSVHDTRVVDGALELRRNPSAGRLARGLATLRRELGLSQAQLAHVAGVTPSAISQAESGARGLSVDTLIALADRLEVSLDRLVMSQPRPGYRLARHDRGRVSYGSGVRALAGDVSAGLRAFFVLLDGGEQGEPPVTHRGSQLIVVVRGLVQVDVDGDAPVLRAGDSLLATSAPVERWRNLRPDPAAFSWVLRD